MLGAGSTMGKLEVLTLVDVPWLGILVAASEKGDLSWFFYYY